MLYNNDIAFDSGDCPETHIRMVLMVMEKFHSASEEAEQEGQGQPATQVHLGTGI